MSQAATEAPIHVTVNGRTESLPSAMSVAELLALRNLAPIRVAVEVNENLVPRREFAGTPIRDGDRIEIVTLVGGG